MSVDIQVQECAQLIKEARTIDGFFLKLEKILLKNKGVV